MSTNVSFNATFFADAGKCPVTLSSTVAFRVVVSDTPPAIDTPGMQIWPSGGPKTIQPLTANSHAWIASLLPQVGTVVATSVTPTVPPPAAAWQVKEIGGLDSNAGTEAAPFATIGRAIVAMSASATKTAILRAGRIVDKAPWSLGDGMSLMAHPNDAPHSMLIVTGGRAGAAGRSGIVLKGLRFDAGGWVEFDDCAFKVFGCKWGKSGGPNLQFYGPRAGSRIQGNWFAGLTWDPSHPTWGVYPLNGVWNDGKDSDDIIISDNDVDGGTFAFQLQRQGGGIHTRTHVDRNKCHGWGSSAATKVGNLGISMVAGGDPRNAENSCSFNTLLQSADRGTVWGQGIEATTAGMTYQGNVIDAVGGMCFGRNPGAVAIDNDITVPAGWAAFSNDGGYDPDRLEIGPNRINGKRATGPTDPLMLCKCSPLPTSTGLPRYAPSAPYVPS